MPIFGIAWPRPWQSANSICFNACAGDVGVDRSTGFAVRERHATRTRHALKRAFHRQKARRRHPTQTILRDFQDHFLDRPLAVSCCDTDHGPPPPLIRRGCEKSSRVVFALPKARFLRRPREGLGGPRMALTALTSVGCTVATPCAPRQFSGPGSGCLRRISSA